MSFQKIIVLSSPLPVTARQKLTPLPNNESEIVPPTAQTFLKHLPPHAPQQYTMDAKYKYTSTTLWQCQSLDLAWRAASQTKRTLLEVIKNINCYVSAIENENLKILLPTSLP